MSAAGYLLPHVKNHHWYLEKWQRGTMIKDEADGSSDNVENVRRKDWGLHPER